MLSNEEFGSRIGVSHSMASRIRNGRRLPGILVIGAIHREFGIPLARLHRAYADGPDAFGRLVSETLDRDHAAAA